MIRRMFFNIMPGNWLRPFALQFSIVRTHTLLGWKAILGLSSRFCDGTKFRKKPPVNTFGRPLRNPGDVWNHNAWFVCKDFYFLFYIVD